jgi:hypothetical protein
MSPLGGEWWVGWWWWWEEEEEEEVVVGGGEGSQVIEVQQLWFVDMVPLKRETKGIKY